jgi:hypothetical protein
MASVAAAGWGRPDLRDAVTGYNSLVVVILGQLLNVQVVDEVFFLDLGLLVTSQNAVDK